MKINPNSLKYQRLLRGFTQQKLADKAELSLSYVQQLESGRFGGKVQTIRKLADALDVSVEDIADFDELVG